MCRLLKKSYMLSNVHDPVCNRYVQVLHPFGYERYVAQLEFFLENSLLALPSLSDIPSRTFAIVHILCSMYLRPARSLSFAWRRSCLAKPQNFFSWIMKVFTSLQSRLRYFFFLVVHSSTLGLSPLWSSILCNLCKVVIT